MFYCECGGCVEPIFLRSKKTGVSWFCCDSCGAADGLRLKADPNLDPKKIADMVNLIAPDLDVKADAIAGMDNFERIQVALWILKTSQWREAATEIRTSMVHRGRSSYRG